MKPIRSIEEFEEILERAKKKQEKGEMKKEGNDS